MAKKSLPCLRKPNHHLEQLFRDSKLAQFNFEFIITNHEKGPTASTLKYPLEQACLIKDTTYNFKSEIKYNQVVRKDSQLSGRIIANTKLGYTSQFGSVGKMHELVA